MIVVDTNVIVSLLVPHQRTHWAEEVLARDPLWAAPLLWRSEFRNVLARSVRLRKISLPQALQLQSAAEGLFADREYAVPSDDVLKAAATSGCSAYDCEFVVLAQLLGTQLITADQQVLDAFPDVAVALEKFANS